MRKRVIFLVDMNAFFISCETTRHPELAGIPAAVAGDPRMRSGIVLSPNYEARRYGVKTTMTVFQAKKACPEIVFVQPSHRFYCEMSRRVMDLFSEYTPVLEQNSIDEAWLDLTGCPGSDSPAVTAGKIMYRIKTELGLYCSVGISENKFLSKMASDMKKPMGITELWAEDVPSRLWPLPVERMYGVGRKTSKKLCNMGITAIGDIAKFGGSIMRGTFGRYGERLYSLASGIDFDPVVPRKHGEIKSIGRSTTLPEDLLNFETAKKIMLSLSEKIGEEARNSTKKCTTVQIIIKYSDFQSVTRQKCVQPTNITSDIYSASVGLLQKNWDSTKKIRLLGISITGFAENSEMRQLSLFDENEAGDCPCREEILEKAVDGIRKRFGESTLKRASLISDGFCKPFKEKLSE